MGEGETGYFSKCKRSVWLSESMRQEPKECVQERVGKSYGLEKEMLGARDEDDKRKMFVSLQRRKEKG